MATILFNSPNPQNPAARMETLVTLDDAHVLSFVTAICNLRGYQPIINGAPNPEGPGIFAIRHAMYWREDMIKQYEKLQADSTIVSDSNTRIAEMVIESVPLV